MIYKNLYYKNGRESLREKIIKLVKVTGQDELIRKICGNTKML